MHLRTLAHTARTICWRALAILTPSLALAGCSSGTKGRVAVAPAPLLASDEVQPPHRLPTWISLDGSYEIVARDVREIAAVQPLIEREYERFRALHGVAPRRVQFVIDDDATVARDEAIVAPLAEGMRRVKIPAAYAPAPSAIVGSFAPRERAEAHP